MNYYEKNKEKIKERARLYYHKHKNNPNSSHYLPYRLKLQRDAYKKNKGGQLIYKKKDYKIIFNYGNYIIHFH